MKKLLIILILLTCGICSGQNLVPNPSFENYSSCLLTPGRINFALPWFQPSIWHGNTTNSSSSDYYNTCGNSLFNPLCGIPSNAFGYQYARTGDGYAGIYVSYGYNYAEYIEVPLSAPLIANRKYCLSFYVSLSAKYWLATSNIGAYFSPDSLLEVSGANVIDSVIPQIDNPSSNILNDTANWMLVSGSFIAAGGEKFMTIGNFHDSINATFQTLPWGQGDAVYYYFDDFSLVDCTSVGLNEITGEEIISIYPNPIKDKLNIQLNNYEPTEIILYDLSSRKLLQQTFTNTTTINTEQLAKGMYLYQVRNKNGIIKNGKVSKE